MAEHGAFIADEPGGCEVCGAVGVAVEADHHPVPFGAIAREFIAVYGVPEILPGDGAGCFRNPRQEREWKEWHWSRAEYRRVCEACSRGTEA